jgi:hypothetical protein
MRILAALIAALPLGLAVPSADAVPAKKAGAKSPPACGAKILPLVAGNTWTYIPGVAPAAILPELVKIAPRQPLKIVITVKSVEAKGTDTVATLEEKVTYEITAENKEKKKPAVMSELVVASSIKCNKTKFEISPESFFFAGEPGGYRELTFDKVDRSKDTSLKLTNGVIGDAPWREDVVAHFTRQPTKTSTAKMSPGRLELERSFTPETSEPVTTKSGTRYPKAEKLALLTTGRVTFDAPVSPTPAPSELPKGWYTKFWFEPEVGVVQTLNMYAHLYQLSESTLN